MYHYMSKAKFIERMADDEITETNASALYNWLEIIHKGEYLFDMGELVEQWDQATLDEIRRAHPAEFDGLDDAQALDKLGRMTTIIQSEEEPFLIGRF